MAIRKILWALLGPALLAIVWPVPAQANHPFPWNESGCHAEFGAPSYEVEEGWGSFRVHVTVIAYAGGFHGRAPHCEGTSGSVDYATRAREATAEDDFEPKSGTLTFPDDDYSDVITIEILEDTRVEGDETFWIHLSNPEGRFTSVGASATVLITDNDTPLPGGDPAEPQGPRQAEIRPEEQAQPDVNDSESGPLPAGSEGWTVADRAPTVEGVGVVGDPEGVRGQTGARGAADGWAAALIAALILGGLAVMGIAARGRLTGSRS